jgi:hypothetical protein
MGDDEVIEIRAGRKPASRGLSPLKKDLAQRRRGAEKREKTGMGIPPGISWGGLLLGTRASCSQQGTIFRKISRIRDDA